MKTKISMGFSKLFSWIKKHNNNIKNNKGNKTQRTKYHGLLTISPLTVPKYCLRDAHIVLSLTRPATSISRQQLVSKVRRVWGHILYLDKPQGSQAWVQVVHTYRRPSCCPPNHMAISMGAPTSLTWLVFVNTMKVTYGFSSRTDTTNVSFLPAAKVRHTISTLQKRKEKRSEERRVGKECRSRWSPYH